MSTISNAEKETIYLTNEKDDFYSVFTYNSTLKTRLEQFAEKYPELCRLTATNSEGAVTYEVAKDRVKIRLAEPLSAERRRALSERAKTSGFGKSDKGEQ